MTSSRGVARTNNVVCYYASWAHYRQGPAKYSLDDIPVDKCTHLVYAFATLDARDFVAKQHDRWLDEDLKNYRKFVQLKEKNPKLKILLALGGWNDSRSTKYSQLVSDPDKRSKFVSEAVKLVLEYGFDGLDLDWEYPGYEWNPNDKQGFTAWLVDLRKAFDPHGLLLTAAVSAGKSTIDRGYDIPKVAKLLDMINLMSYDFHGSWENRVAHHAPLYADPGQNPELCVDFAVNYWIKKGAPPHKLIMGVPAYGRTWTLAGSDTSPGAAAAGAGREGRHVRERGSLPFFECCLAEKEGWTKRRTQAGPYLTKGNQWVGYDDVQSVVQKAQYATDMGLGGVMMWDITTDDFGDVCGEGKNPLLTAMVRTLHGDPPSVQSVSQHKGRPSSGAKPSPSSFRDPRQGGVSFGSQGSGSPGTAPAGGNAALEGSVRTTTPGSVGDGETITRVASSGPTTELPYPWLAWPVFSRSPEDILNFNAISTTKAPLRSFQTPSPLTSRAPAFPSFTSFTSPPSFPSSPALSPSLSLSPSITWFGNCRDEGFAPDPASCSSFYRCTEEFAYKFSCPGGLLWNHDQSSCDWPRSVQCVLPLTQPDLRPFLPPEII